MSETNTIVSIVDQINGNGRASRFAGKVQYTPLPSGTRTGKESTYGPILLDFVSFSEPNGWVDATEEFMPNATDRENGKKVASVYSAVQAHIRNHADLTGKVRVKRQGLKLILTNIPKNGATEESNDLGTVSNAILGTEENASE